MFATAKCKACRRALAFLRLRGETDRSSAAATGPSAAAPWRLAQRCVADAASDATERRGPCASIESKVSSRRHKRQKNQVMTYRMDYRRADRARYRPCIRLLVMLAQIGVKRLPSGLSQQCLEHHVPAPTHRKMLAIGLSQRLDAGVAVLLVDAAGRIAMPPVQALLGLLSHVTLPNC